MSYDIAIVIIEGENRQQKKGDLTVEVMSVAILPSVGKATFSPGAFFMGAFCRGLEYTSHAAVVSAAGK